MRTFEDIFKSDTPISKDPFMDPIFESNLQHELKKAANRKKKKKLTKREKYEILEAEIEDWTIEHDDSYKVGEFDSFY